MLTVDGDPTPENVERECERVRFACAFARAD
jgi:hypothetical protein